MPTTIRLHDYWRSSASYRVRIALELKGVAYQLVPTNLVVGEQRGTDYLDQNPQGFVPMLDIDGLQLTQSLAIVDYLDTAFPERPLIPAEPAARARIMAMALAIACDVHPLNNLRVLDYLGERQGVDKDGRDQWVRHWISEGFDALEKMATGCDPYLDGERPGIADLCLVPQIYNARRFGVDLAPYPTLVAIDARLTVLPPFERAHPDAVRPD